MQLEGTQIHTHILEVNSNSPFQWTQGGMGMEKNGEWGKRTFSPFGNGWVNWVDCWIGLDWTKWAEWTQTNLIAAPGEGYLPSSTSPPHRKQQLDGGWRGDPINFRERRKVVDDAPIRALHPINGMGACATCIRGIDGGWRRGENCNFLPWIVKKENMQNCYIK